MDCYESTMRYYAKWLGVDAASMCDIGVRAVYSGHRNVALPGHGKQYDLCVWRRGATTLISYGDRAAAEVAALARQLQPGATIEQLTATISECYGQAPAHSIKFVFERLLDIQSSARALTADEYPLYEAFFTSNNPGAADIGWLREYYDSIVAKQYAYGVFVDGRLVSATDAPDMPFMSTKVQEIGIATLAEHRGKGYARMACAACIASLLSRNICPLWSTGIANVASQRLAHSVGFEQIADVLSLSL